MSVHKLLEMWVWPFSRGLYSPPALLWKSLRINSTWRFPTHPALRVVARNPSRAAFHTTICLRKSASDPGQIAWNAEEQQMNRSQGMWERKKWPKLGVGCSLFGYFFFIFIFSLGRFDSNFGPCFGLILLLKRKKAKTPTQIHKEIGFPSQEKREEWTSTASMGEKTARGGNFLGSVSWVLLVTSERG